MWGKLAKLFLVFFSLVSLQLDNGILCNLVYWHNFAVPSHHASAVLFNPYPPFVSLTVFLFVLLVN